jgi:hypothetical protein
MDVNNLSDIAGALAKAQAEMQNPAFDSANPHYRNKFASLAAVRNSVVPVLAKHGIAMCQDITSEGGAIACRTILTHASGQQMVFGPLTMPAMKADAQGLGSAATYARRYSLMAVAGVVGDDDDDGNAASANKDKHSPLGVVKVDGTAEKYAAAFRAALEDGDVVAVHHDCKAEGEEVYRAAWSLLDSKARSAIKRAIDAAKDAA